MSSWRGKHVEIMFWVMGEMGDECVENVLWVMGESQMSRSRGRSSSRMNSAARGANMLKTCFG
jgi:hypothetical protein